VERRGIPISARTVTDRTEGVNPSRLSCETADKRGPVATITGAGSGLGEAMALAFSAAGYSLAALDIEKSRAEATAAAIRGMGRTAIAVGVDVSDPPAMTEAARLIEADLGPVTVLCANVGVQQFGTIERLTQEDWQWVLMVNVFGTVNTVTAFLPSMRRADGHRRIVLTASSAVHDPGARLGAYTASKHAVVGIGETLRLELEPDNIGVTILFPGGMVTRHLESSAAARPPEFGPSVTLSEDFDVVVASARSDVESVVHPGYAIRHLLEDLRNGERYIVTHGSYREKIEERSQALLAAFDRQA
jgi:NAD(P)-dependent dehydrogenase (short-subunit alcohol dehydrogenase family)